MPKGGLNLMWSRGVELIFLCSGAESVSFVTRALLKLFFSISRPLLSLFRGQAKAEKQNQRPLWASSSEHTCHLRCACEHCPEMETAHPQLRKVCPCSLAKMGTWKQERRLWLPTLSTTDHCFASVEPNL